MFFGEISRSQVENAQVKKSGVFIYNSWIFHVKLHENTRFFHVFRRLILNDFEGSQHGHKQFLGFSGSKHLKVRETQKVCVGA